ncbi:DUF7220 family protein, partial [Nioella halotolerans]
MKQSRIMSMVEAATNVVVGYGLPSRTSLKMERATKSARRRGS